MKKLFLITAILLGVMSLNAQSLEEIVKKYTVANQLDKLSGLKTIKLTATMSMSGMDIPIVIWMKNPDKIKTITDFNGQQMIQSFDGVKGYVISPFTGSTDPVELPDETAKGMLRNSIFQNYIAEFLKNGQLTLDGEEAVNGSAAYKIKVTAADGSGSNIYIDKASSLLVKTTGTMENQGQTITVESYPSDYKEINGVFLPGKTMSMMSGMEMIITFTNVEIDVPIEDSAFTLK